MNRVALLTLVTLGCGGSSSGPAEDDWLIPQLTREEGLSMRTPEFDVAAGEEVQDCYFFEVPEAMSVDHIELALNTGSHHMNVFRVKTITGLDPAAGAPVELGALHGTVIRGSDAGGECWRSSNWSDWPLIANSQQSGASQQVIDWKLPEGVATTFKAGERLMLQIHYVNSTDQATPEVARGGVNLYRSHDGDSMELGTVFAAAKQLRVCRSTPIASASAGCTLPAGVHTIAAANGHFHSRGQRFRMWTWDGASPQPVGTPFYENGDWAEPRMETDLAVQPPTPGGVYWTCDYQWREPEGGCAAVDAADPLQANDCCYVFGPKVETSEHCNAFVYYYPATANDAITCGAEPGPH